MFQTIINYLFGDKLVDKYAKALHEGDVDTCIEYARQGTAEQKKKMQEQWNLFYN